MDYSNVLIDLMNRVIELEKRVAKLEVEREESQKGITAEESAAKGYEYDFDSKKGASYENVEIQRRDSTKYIFNGVLYKKKSACFSRSAEVCARSARKHHVR